MSAATTPLRLTLPLALVLWTTIPRHALAATDDATILKTAPAVPPWNPIDKPVMQGPLTCLTKRTSDEVHGRLVRLQLFPSLCQNAMDENQRVFRQQCDGQRLVDATTCNAKVEHVKESGWRPLEIVGLVAGAAAVGYVIGKVTH